VSKPTPYGVRRKDLGHLLGSEELARRLLHHGWLKPVVQQKKLTLFDSGDVALCWQRIRSGELPPPLPR
jgi:hypothetical protein